MGSNKNKNRKRFTKVTGNNVKHEQSKPDTIQAIQRKSKDKKASDNIPAADQNHDKSDDLRNKDQTNQRSCLRSGLNWILNQMSYLRSGLNWIIFVILLPFKIILKILIWIFNQVLWLLNFIKGVLQLISGYKKVQSKDEELKTKLDEFKDTIALLETEKQDALKLVEELRVKIAILETEKGDALTLFEGSKVTLENAEIEKVNTTIELKKFKDNVAVLTKEKEDGLISLQKCKKDLQNVESEKKNALASLEKFKDKTAKLEKEKEDALTRLQQNKNTLQNVELEKKNALESLESLKETTSKLEKKKENALTRLHQYKKDLQNVEFEKKEALSRCETFKHAMAILEKEKDESLTRLSELMGNKLRENNPAITNLNDPNRPMKLGEQFGELYENEWTDAFSEISENKELNLNEFETIDILLNILKEIDKVCREDVSNHMTENSLNDKADTKHEVSFKAVKETLKSNAASYIPLLCKNITEDGSICTLVLQYKDYSLPYIEQCVKICYLAVLHDPPMYINFEPDKIYDKQAFKEYTKSGSEVNFLVWPALHLHQNGPILCKGVVQPKE